MWNIWLRSLYEPLIHDLLLVKLIIVVFLISENLSCEHWLWSLSSVSFSQFQWTNSHNIMWGGLQLLRDVRFPWRVPCRSDENQCPHVKEHQWSDVESCEQQSNVQSNHHDLQQHQHSGLQLLYRSTDTHQLFCGRSHLFHVLSLWVMTVKVLMLSLPTIWTVLGSVNGNEKPLA